MTGNGKKDLPPNDDSFAPPDSTRRKFLGTIAVLGGASLLYSIPVVRALAQTGARTARTNKIDVKFPAVYGVRDEEVVLNITPSGKRTAVPVKFLANGSVKLTATKDRSVAEVEVISLSLVSRGTPNLGDNTERITARLAAGTRVGSLNLATGELKARGNFAVDVTLAPSTGGKDSLSTCRAPIQYSSARITETPPLPNARSSQKCVNTGDVSTKVAIRGRPAVAVNGALNFRMTPQA
jgi:hypothetical protein